MCGIFCVYNESGVEQDNKACLSSLRTMAHRGPDDEGFYSDNDVFIGHRRLSILDLSSRGHQPMVGADGQVIFAYNGEIYNYLGLRSLLLSKGYKFVSTSDAEVFLNMYLEYGDECFRMLRGMWAVVIWDKRSRKLLVSRDRLGIKPLYIYRGRNIVISSEIKGILHYDGAAREADEVSIYKYVTRGWIDDSVNTLFSKIRCVESGSFLKITNSSFQNKRYWNLSISTTAGQKTEDFFENFKETLKLHMQSDVPVSMSLSGGIDSSSIACVLSKSLGMRDKIHAFSIRPPETEDESYWIDATVRHCGIRHDYIDMTNINYSSLIDEMIKAHDEPPVSSSHFYQTVLRKHISNLGYKVMLIGEGADEILGGYAKLVPMYIASLLSAGLYSDAVSSLLGFRELTKESFIKMLFRTGKYFYNRAGSRRIQEHRFGYRVLNNDALHDEREVFPDFYHTGLDDVSEGKYFFKELFDRRYLDINYILKTEDRDGMAYSMEVRPPFLDHELVEHAFSFPFYDFMKGGVNKFILRDAVRHVLTPEVYRSREKKGRPGNNAYFVYDVLSPEIKDLLCSRDFTGKGLWNKKCFDWFERDLKVRDYNNAYVWFRVYMISKWYELKDFTDKEEHE